MARGRFSITLDSNSRTGNLAKGLRPSKRMPRNSGGFLVECSGCVGRDGVLSVLDELERIDTDIVTVEYTSRTNSYTVGNTLTGGTSEATGTILRSDVDGTSGTLYLWDVTGTFTDTESISDGTASATADGNSSALATVFPYPQKFVFTNMIIICTSTMIFEWVSDALVHKLTVSAGSTWVGLDFNNYVYLSNGTVAVIRDALDKTYSETTDLPTAMAALNFNSQVILGAPDAGCEE